MANIFTATIENAWQRNRAGSGMFIIGIILCLAGVILSFFWRLGFASYSDNTPYVIAMIGIGITFILTGINIISQPHRLPKWYAGIYKKYIEENEVLIIESMVPIILMVLLFMSYPDGWRYPQIYIIFVPYTICIILLIINILINIGEKDTEITYIRGELNRSNIIIREKEEMHKDSAAPDYVVGFTEKLKRNIDELKSVMDDLKTNIDDGAKNISERTVSVANKYRSDNEQLHNDVQKFKQRMEKEKDEFKERANERIIKNLMKTLESIDEMLKYNKNTYLIKEIEGIKQDIYNTLKNEDIEIINPSIGDDFDDKKCCAIQMVETDKFPEKKIVDIKKIGCMFKSGKVIKYADVVVSNSKEKINATGDIKDGKVGEDNKIKTDADPKILTDEKIENTMTREDNKTKTDEIISNDSKTKTDEKVEKII